MIRFMCSNVMSEEFLGVGQCAEAGQMTKDLPVKYLCSLVLIEDVLYV